jgi:hypothetical protein
MWRLWAKALGEKASSCSQESDKVALVRTGILATYIVTNAFIVAGVVRHWDDEFKPKPVYQPGVVPVCSAPWKH